MNFRIKLTKHLSIGPSGLRFLTKHGSIGRSGLLLHGNHGSVWLPTPKQTHSKKTKEICCICNSKNRLWKLKNDKIVCETCAEHILNKTTKDLCEIEDKTVVTPGCDVCKKLNRPLYSQRGGYMVCEPCLNNNFIFLNDKTAQIM